MADKIDECNCYCTCGICFRREEYVEDDDYYIHVERVDSRFGPICEWTAYSRVEDDDSDEDDQSDELASGFELTMKNAIAAAKKAAESALEAKI